MSFSSPRAVAVAAVGHMQYGTVGGAGSHGSALQGRRKRLCGLAVVGGAGVGGIKGTEISTKCTIDLFCPTVCLKH